MSIETLSGAHDLSTFDSGADELDDWLRRRAFKAHQAGDAVVRVAVSPIGRVVGFHALSAASIERAFVPGALRRNSPDPIPVLLLARLGVDRDAQGRGVGAALVADVARRAIAAADLVGFRALIIHCRDAAALAFYTRLLSVKPLPTSDLHVYVPVTSLRLPEG